jgi:RNA polymerase sigma-70 factor (ECF subfamily)
MPDDPTCPDEFELARRWGEQGDTEAGRLLVESYYGHLRRFFVSSVSDATREDLIQETFLRLTTAVEAFEGRAPFRTYVLRIARNVLCDHLRRHSRRGDFDPLTQSVEELDSETPSRALAELERNQVLLGCVRSLPLEIKQTVELRYWHDLKVHEVAMVLQIKEGTVRSRLFAARKRLRACLATAAALEVHVDRHSDAELEEIDPGLVDELLELGRMVDDTLPKE